jgi:hypothetical protein
VEGPRTLSYPRSHTPSWSSLLICSAVLCNRAQDQRDCQSFPKKGAPVPVNSPALQCSKPNIFHSVTPRLRVSNLLFSFFSLNRSQGPLPYTIFRRVLIYNLNNKIEVVQASLKAILITRSSPLPHLVSSLSPHDSPTALTSHLAFLNFPSPHTIALVPRLSGHMSLPPPDLRKPLSGAYNLRPNVS